MIQYTDYVLKELTKELENNRSSIDNQNKTFYDMKKKKDSLQNERKLVFHALSFSIHVFIVKIHMHSIFRINIQKRFVINRYSSVSILVPKQIILYE